MASLSGVSSSNTMSSLMNSANMISGLASGLDTESMIESLVKSYQNKIGTLNKQMAKTEWKQDAYRSIISKMVGFNSKYTSYTSSSNLTSPSFFNSSVKVDAMGVFASKVSASGRTSSEISLDKVTQLATGAQYRTSGTNGSGKMNIGDGRNIKAEKAIDLKKGAVPLSRLDGSLTLNYGGETVSIRFDKVRDVEKLKEIKGNSVMTDDEALTQLIQQKLADQKISFNNGNSDVAGNLIDVSLAGDVITFSDKSGAGNVVYISSAGKDLANVLGLELENAKEDKINSFRTPSSLVSNVGLEGYLAGESMSLTLDGVTKKIALPSVSMGLLYDGEGNQLRDKDDNALEYNAEDYTTALNMAVQEAFGPNKIEVTNVSKDSNKLQLNFNVREGSELVINSDVGEALGIGGTASSAVDTNKSLKELLGSELYKLKPAKYRDEFGVEVLDVDEKTGKNRYRFEINGVLIGKYTEDATLSDIMSDINSNKEAGVSVNYSQTTKNFLFKSKETGEDSQIKIAKGGLAEAMFGTTEVEDRGGSSCAEAYNREGLLKDGAKNFTFEIPGTANSTTFQISKDTTMNDVVSELNERFTQRYTFEYNKYSGQIEAKSASDGARVDLKIKDWDGDPVTFDKSKAPSVDYTSGQDAKFTVTINGETKNMTRSSNTVNIDGMSITMKDTFDGSKSADGKEDAVTSAGRPANAVTFQVRTDSDKIVETIKGMIEEYNAIMSEVKSAYTTLPYRKSSNGSFSDYEPLTDDEKASMTESAIKSYEEKAKQGILFGDRNLSNLYDKLRGVFAGANEAELRAMGITVSFSITDGTEGIALDEDKLRSMLESDPERVSDVFTKESGVMQNMKTQLDAYARTTGVPKGILIEQAGSPLSSLSLMNNTWQKEIDNLNSQIEKWQDKLTSQVEKYTSQFSRLEQLIQQMNSQSSTLAGLMGG